MYKRLAGVEKTLQELSKLKELADQREPRPKASNGRRPYEVIEDSDVEIDAEDRGPPNSGDYPRGQAQKAEALEATPRKNDPLRSRSISSLWDWWRRKRTSTKGDASPTRRRTSDSAHLTAEENDSINVQSEQTNTQELHAPLENAQSDFVILQNRGSTSSSSRLNVAPNRANLIVSLEMRSSAFWRSNADEAPKKAPH